MVVSGLTLVSSDSSSLSSESGSSGSSPSLASVGKIRFILNIFSKKYQVDNWKKYIIVYHYLLSMRANCSKPIIYE